MKYILRAHFNDMYYVYLRKIGFTKVITTRFEDKALQFRYYWLAKLICEYVNSLKERKCISTGEVFEFKVIGIAQKRRKLKKF